MSGIDHRDTWTVKAVLRDGALGQRTERPNLVSRCLGRCPRSTDRSTKLGLPVLGTVPSVSVPIDQTWSTGAWDGALDVLVPEPGRQRWCAAEPAGLSASTFRKLLGRLPDREVNPRTRPIGTNTRAGQRLRSTSKRRTTA